MTTAMDIAAYLQTQALGTVGTNIFYGFLPDTPDNAIAIYDTSGRPSELHEIDRPNFQVVVRNTSYANAASVIESIQALLQNVTNTTINSQFYASISNLQAPFSAGWDSEKRVEFKQNYVTIKR